MTPLEKYRLALTEFRVWKAKEFPPGTKIRVDEGGETTVLYGDSCTDVHGEYYELKPDEILILYRGFHTAVNVEDLIKI